MGSDQIRYLVFSFGRWRWKPTRIMRAVGFHPINFGKELTAADKARAIELNDDWDRHRRGLSSRPEWSRRYPVGSVGDGYLRALALRSSERRAKGIVWTSEQHSRHDWPRAWRWIEPLLADCDPKTVTPEVMLELRTLVASKVSQSEAHRTIKVWRALWKRMSVFGYCVADRDPALAFINAAPHPRQQAWREGEAVRLVKCAWRTGYYGLAALLAVAWDSQLSPIDARGLCPQDRRSDPIGLWFDVARAKTGRSAIATLSRRTQHLLTAYERTFVAEPVGRAPIFRNRSGRAYSKDTLGDDFRSMRRMVFGESETRQLADFRRSGTVEALAGKVDPLHLSSKMANSISTSNRLHKTYGPASLSAVREADAARKRGRGEIRAAEEALIEQRPYKSPRSPDQKSQNAVHPPAKSLK